MPERAATDSRTSTLGHDQSRNAGVPFDHTPPAQQRSRIAAHSSGAGRSSGLAAPATTSTCGSPAAASTRSALSVTCAQG